jgi:hypothetical protein
MAIDTRRKLLARLRKLGYAKSQMQMTRGATTYTKGGRLAESRLNISISPHGEFIILDRQKGKNDWSLISSALHIGNLRAGAEQKLSNILAALDAMGIEFPPEMTTFELAWLIAQGAERDTN